MSASNDILIAYYSMSGHTRALAEELRAMLRADAEEIREPHRRQGLLGSARALIDAVVRRIPPILPLRHEPANYDVLLIGGPVWSGRMAAPVRSFAKRYGRSARQIAFFCTEDSRGSKAAFRDLEKLCRCAPLATLAVDGEHLPIEAHHAESRNFVALLTLARH